jgi:hypothetical protein
MDFVFITCLLNITLTETDLRVYIMVERNSMGAFYMS